jgi:2-methylcitrate dehydratase PrpD
MLRRDFWKNTLGLAVLGADIKSGHSVTFQTKPPSEESEQTPRVTQYVSEFIVNTKYDDIPEEVLALGKKSILDGLGLALAGSISEASSLVRKYVESLGICNGKATIIGTKFKTAPRFAAFANGVSIHADDYDDTAKIPGDGVHATVPVLPPSFALCEMEHCTGKELMLAYHLGVEVEGKIAAAILPRHYAEGNHATGTIGSFGSAAACAKLKGLNAMQTAYCLGVVAAEAAGLRDNFGSMTKPFQAGHAAENGTAAADLAAFGWTAAADILEAKRGFFQAAAGGFKPEAIVNRLAKPWTFTSPGVLIKRFPCGTIQQPAMDAMLRLIQANNISPSEVAQVEVGGSRLDVDTLFHHRPMQGLEGKFSMEFCLSVLLIERKATLEQFTDAVVQRPDVQDMIRRVNFVVDPEIEKTGSTFLRIQTKNGQLFSDQARYAKGSPENPMSYDEVADKFRTCVEYAKWPAKKGEFIIQFVRSLENASDLRPLTEALRSDV